jgi:hypothetical protein
VRQRHHRPFYLLAFAALFLMVLFAIVRSQTARKDSLKADSIDRCGNPKAVLAPVVPISAPPKPVRRDSVSIQKLALPHGRKGTAFFFLGSLCPCTDAHKHSIMELMSLAPQKGVRLVAVFPNKGESEELIEHFFKGIGFKMDYIIDSTNRLVKDFGARKTPEVFLVDEKGRVVYSGPIDDSVENLGQVKNAFLKNAVLELAEGRPVSLRRAEGSGCWIVRNR